MPELYFRDHLGHAQTLVSAVLAACNPRTLTLQHLERLELGRGPVHVIAMGKASVAMTSAAGEWLGDRLRFGVCIAPQGTTRPPGFPGAVGLMLADHPLPTQRNMEAADVARYAAEDFGQSAAAGSGAVLLVLISGGGSAHLTLPAHGLEIAELADATNELMLAGCTISELNSVRRHTEQLKGGRLASLAFPGAVRALVLSDVVGDEAETIASGPCSPDPTTYADALAVLDRRGLRQRLSRIARHLEDGLHETYPETPKPGDPRLAHTQTELIGSNATAVRAADDALRGSGFRMLATRENVTGEAADVGRALARAIITAAEQREPGGPPLAIVWGGETTVTVRGQGVGGRNQELALAAAVELDGRPDLAVMTFATDGIDGPTDAAGAIVSGLTSADAAVAGLDARAALQANDSHTFFVAMESTGRPALLRTGATGTNVADVCVALAY
jgi:glycerate 2-kinase